MLLKRDFEFLNDEKQTVIMRSTYDVGMAADVVKEVTDAGGGRSKNGEMRYMGSIPPEEFQYNPWLIQAQRAQAAGDKAEYVKMIQKYFELFPQYKAILPKKYY